MIPVQDMIKKLAENLDHKRFQHSINVMDEAEKMAIHYGADAKKAIIAGLLHDCGKNCSGTRMTEFLEFVGHTPDTIEKIHPKLLHGLAGTCIAEREYGVDDAEILSAIRWHTTGKEEMTKLEKIIFVADYIEIGRVFPEVVRLREVAWHDLDEAVLMCADLTISHIIRKGGLIHPNTLNTRNEMVLHKLMR